MFGCIQMRRKKAANRGGGARTSFLPEFPYAQFRQRENRLGFQCRLDDTFVGMDIDFATKSHAC
jgi:hypothetical protein